MSTAVIERETTREPLPVCLWKENSNRLVSLWDMLQNYLPFYEISRNLGEQRERAGLLKGTGAIHDPDQERFKGLLGSIKLHCTDFVPVQREVERGRSPLANIPPFGRGFLRHRGLPIRWVFEERESGTSALRSSSR